MHLNSSLVKSLSVVFILTVTLSACGPQYSGNSNSTDFLSGVIGGQEVKPGDPLAKSVVVLYDTQTKMLCTASIITPKHLVSAAHCVDPDNVKNLRVIYGTNSTDHNLIVASGQIAAAILAPAWQPKLLKKVDKGDIAVLRLASPLADGYGPVEVLNNPALIQVGTAITIEGYGITTGHRTANSKDDDGIGILRSTTTKILNPKFGQSEILIDESQGKGSCHGDSGGPAYIQVGTKNFLFGLTSRGTDDTCSATVVYTNLMSYYSWLPEAFRQLETRVVSVPGASSGASSGAASSATPSTFSPFSVSLQK